MILNIVYRSRGLPQGPSRFGAGKTSRALVAASLLENLVLLLHREETTQAIFIPIVELHIHQTHPPDKSAQLGCILQPKTYNTSALSISTPTHPLPFSRPPAAHLVTMASEDHKSKKDKKEKKEKKLSTDRVDKKKDKKDKKADKEKLKQKVADSLDRQLQADAAQSVADDDDDHPGSDFETIKDAEVTANTVYFAVPLADAKGHKKVFKTIKKGKFPPLLGSICILENPSQDF